MSPQPFAPPLPLPQHVVAPEQLGGPKSHILTFVLSSGPNCPLGLRRDRVGRTFPCNRLRVL